MCFLKYSCLLLTTLICSNLIAALDVAIGVNTIPRILEKNPPLKTNYFLELISQGIYVDKTLMIDVVIRHSERVLVITNPRKWGKTTNLHMLKTFLEIQVHPNGTKMLPIANTQNYQLFSQGCYRHDHFNVRLEKPFLISNEKYKDTIDKYLGRVPVIRVSFADTAFMPLKNCTIILGLVIAKAFKEHKYLLQVYDRVRDNEREGQEVEERETFEMYLKNRAETEEDLLLGIKFLCQELYYYLREDVYLLIDDYDRYLNPKDANVIQYFYKKTLKDNKFLKKAILTGLLALEIKYDDAFYYEFLDNSYFYPFYGYTLKEMLLIYHIYRMPKEEQNHIAYWYDGYRTSEDDQEKIFNPWSVAGYMNTQREESYWINETSHDRHLGRICDLSDFQYAFTHLIQGRDYDVDGIQTRFYLIFLNSRLDVNTAIGYLVTAGYLTPVKTYLWEGEVKRISTVRIPNHEIASHLQNVFKTRLPRMLGHSAYESLKNASDILEQFLVDDRLTSPELEQHFNSSTNVTKKHLIHSIVMAAIAAGTFEFVNWSFLNLCENETNVINTRSDILMSLHDRGIIINVLQEQQHDSAINLYTSQNIPTFEKYARFHFWRDIKLVDCNIRPDKSLEISSVIHTFNIKKTTTSSPSHGDWYTKVYI